MLYTVPTDCVSSCETGSFTSSTVQIGSGDLGTLREEVNKNELCRAGELIFLFGKCSTINYGMRNSGPTGRSKAGNSHETIDEHSRM